MLCERRREGRGGGRHEVGLGGRYMYLVVWGRV